MGKGLASSAAEGNAVRQHNSQPAVDESAGRTDLAQVQKLIDQNLQVFQNQVLSGEMIKQHMRNNVKDLKFQMKKQKDDTTKLIYKYDVIK